MAVYLFPIKIALIFFPIISMVLSIPYAVFSYRKYGKINLFRTFIFFTFIFYIMTAFFLTLLPLPIEDKPRIATGSEMQLIPFNFVRDFINNTAFVIGNPKSYLHIFAEPAFIQAFFNALLLLPLGVYLRYYFQRSFKKTVLITFLVSLFFEITQVTGIYGIYKYPYRLFDVDDLILNTFSGIIGYSITPILTYLLPNIKKVKKEDFMIGMYSSYLKRIIAFLIDWTLLGFIPRFNKIGIFILATFIYFMVIPYFTNGYTIGKFIVKMKLEENGNLKFVDLLKRYSILIYGYFLPLRILSSVIAYLNSIEKYDFMILLFFIQIFFNIFVIIHILYHMIKRDPILIHDRISGISNFNIK